MSDLKAQYEKETGKKVFEEYHDNHNDRQLKYSNSYIDRLEQKTEEAEKYKGLYYELIFAVGNKWEGETRHETALRYIKQAETGSDEVDQAKKEKE